MKSIRTCIFAGLACLTMAYHMMFAADETTVPAWSGDTDLLLVVKDGVLVASEDLQRFEFFPLPEPIDKERLIFITGEPANDGGVFLFFETCQHETSCLHFNYQDWQVEPLPNMPDIDISKDRETRKWHARSEELDGNNVFEVEWTGEEQGRTIVWNVVGKTLFSDSGQGWGHVRTYGSHTEGVWEALPSNIACLEWRRKDDEKKEVSEFEIRMNDTTITRITVPLTGILTDHPVFKADGILWLKMSNDTPKELLAMSVCEGSNIFIWNCIASLDGGQTWQPFAPDIVGYQRVYALFPPRRYDKK